MELQLEQGERIVSRSDLDGNLVEGNPIFWKMTEYEPEEILGKPHNVIRHPDMPQIAFRLLWSKIYNDRDINAFVLNRTKNNNHYWVYATVSPVTDRKSGEKKGYISIRKRPNYEAVKQIEDIYEILRDVEKQDGYEAAKEVLRGLLEKHGMRWSDLMSKMQAQGAILSV